MCRLGVQGKSPIYAQFFNEGKAAFKNSLLIKTTKWNHLGIAGDLFLPKIKKEKKRNKEKQSGVW